MNGPIFSANYNGLQSQVTRNAGKNASIGLVYTYSHAFNYADNGAGTGSTGPSFNYPGYYKMNRAQASQDQKHNVQIWGISTLPFGYGQKWLNHGLIAEIVGGWQVTGQYSYFGGLPFSVTANSNTLNAPGSTLYAQLVAPYQVEHGHNRDLRQHRSFRRQAMVQSGLVCQPSGAGVQHSKYDHRLAGIRQHPSQPVPRAWHWSRQREHV